MSKRDEALELADVLERTHPHLREVTSFLRQWPEQPETHDVLDEALVVAHLGTLESFKDARTALNALICWNVDVALDPSVSEAARKLSGAERIAALESENKVLAAKLEVSEAASKAAVSKAQWQSLTNREMNAAQERINTLEAAAREAREFLEFCWRDVSMNDYSTEKLNTAIAALDRALGGGS